MAKTYTDLVLDKFKRKYPHAYTIFAECNIVL